MTRPDHLTSEMRVRVGTPHPLGAGKSCSEPQNPRGFLFKREALAPQPGYWQQRKPYEANLLPPSVSPVSTLLFNS